MKKITLGLFLILINVVVVHAKTKVFDNSSIIGLGAFSEAYVKGSGLYDNNEELYAPLSVFGKPGFREVATDSVLDLNFYSDFNRLMQANSMNVNASLGFTTPWVSLSASYGEMHSSSVDNSTSTAHLYMMINRRTLSKLQINQDDFTKANAVLDQYKGNPMGFYEAFGDGYLQYAEGVSLIFVDMQFDFKNKVARQQFDRNTSASAQGGYGVVSINALVNYSDSLTQESQSSSGSLKVKIMAVGIPDKNFHAIRGMVYNGKGLTTGDYSCDLKDMISCGGSNLFQTLYSLKPWMGDFKQIYFPPTKGEWVGQYQLTDQPVTLYKKDPLLKDKFRTNGLSLDDPSSEQSGLEKQASQEINYLTREQGYYSMLSDEMQLMVERDLTTDIKTPFAVFQQYFDQIGKYIEKNLIPIVSQCSGGNMKDEKFDFTACQNSILKYEADLNAEKKTAAEFWLKSYPYKLFWVTTHYNKNEQLVQPENLFCLYSENEKSLRCEVIGDLWGKIPAEQRQILFKDIASGTIDDVGNAFESLPFFFVADPGANSITTRDLYLKFQSGETVRDCRYRDLSPRVKTMKYMGAGILVLPQLENIDIKNKLVCGEALKQDARFIGYGLTPNMGSSSQVKWLEHSVPIDSLEMKIMLIGPDSDLMLSKTIDFSRLIFTRINGHYAFVGADFQKQVDAMMATADPFNNQGKVDFNIKDVAGQSHLFSFNIFETRGDLWPMLLNGGKKLLKDIDLVPVIDDLTLANQQKCIDLDLTGNRTEGYLLRMICNDKVQYLHIFDQSVPFGTILINPDISGKELIQRVPLMYIPAYASVNKPHNGL